MHVLLGQSEIHHAAFSKQLTLKGPPATPMKFISNLIAAKRYCLSFAGKVQSANWLAGFSYPSICLRAGDDIELFVLTINIGLCIAEQHFVI